MLTGYTISTNSGDVGQNHGNTDFWVVKINGSGALQWQKTLGGNADDRPNAIAVTSEGKRADASRFAACLSLRRKCDLLHN